MDDKPFKYSDIKHDLGDIAMKLHLAGYEIEADALMRMTHIIGSRIEPHDLSHKFGIEHYFDCLEARESLISFLQREWKDTI